MSKYSQIVNPKDQGPLNPPPDENALLANERIAWLSSPATQKMIRMMADEAKVYENEARSLAVNYAVNQNHLRIVALLQHADVLHKLIEKHGKLK